MQQIVGAGSPHPRGPLSCVCGIIKHLLASHGSEGSTGITILEFFTPVDHGQGW